MPEPEIANPKPYYVEPQQGDTYLWCSCGRSKRQPYCDGSHKGTGFEPVRYTAKAAGEEVLFCGCKHTGTPPFCDGTHNNLPGGYREDDPHSRENQAVPEVTEQTDARRLLNGGSYVFSTRHAELTERAGVRYCQVISPSLGSRYQSQFYLELGCSPSPVMAFGERHVIMFLAAGHATINISGRDFPVGAGDGIYVRPAEAFRVVSETPEQLRLFVSVCPAAREIEWLTQMPDNFDDEHPERVVETDADKRHVMASRFFQMLVDKRVGSDVVTQFIGNIPASKAEPHRHLYEEALIILNGRGYMWTEDRKTAVAPGDVVFLPRKQIHSMQCTDNGGMDVVGVIYPGDNPSISY